MKFLARPLAPMKCAALSCLLAAQLAAAVPFASWTETELRLNNGLVERKISLPAPVGPFLTKTYQPVTGEFKFFLPASTDFQFTVNRRTYSGESEWRLARVSALQDARGGDGAAVVLRSLDGKLEVTVNYLLYPDLPVVRKSLAIRNLDPAEVALESVDVEKLNVAGYWPTTFSWVCSDYGRRRSIGPYEGTMQDALVIVHNPDWEAGIVLGNEASGVMKRTAVFWGEQAITSGLTHATARFPFRKWLRPGETYVTPEVFTMVYNRHKDPDEILNTAVPDFVRRHLGTRLAGLKHKPTFVYNTWHPFGPDINEQLIIELADAAAAAGMKEFVIDDGWQDSYGDWGIDRTKFPRGLKPVFDHIKSLGMKPGLWVSVGSASAHSKVFQQHPEWFVRDQAGNFANLQLDGEVGDIRSACFNTGWKDYIKGVLLNLAGEHGLEYLKLDFAVVTSAYRFNPVNAGCYATDHPGHKDQPESLAANYEPMWRLFDELHAAKPELFIDCTFETMGGLQLVDYAMLKHAEGSWLSNFVAPDEKGDLRIRNMAWWRSPAIAATALVIGNPRMDDAGWENHLKSLAGALPIMLGDPRKLSPAVLQKYRGFADWLQAMETHHGIMSYRQDLAGFGEPKEGAWDGFQRINTDSKEGGIVGVFRHGSPERQRTVTVRYLDPDRRYKVSSPDGTTRLVATGRELATQGWVVELDALYAGELFEVGPL